MNIKFLNDINSNQMVIENISDFSIKDHSLRLLELNEIKGILSLDCEIMDGNAAIVYDITDKDCFSRLYENAKMSFYELKMLIFSIRSMIRSMNAYLLDCDNIILKKECIFVDRETGRYEYCYFPFYHGNLLLELREFFSELLAVIDYNDQKAVRLAYDIQKMSQTDNFTLGDFTRIAGKIAIEREPEEDSEAYFGEPKAGTVVKRKAADGAADVRAGLKGGDKKESFFEKAGVYFRETGSAEIFDDINKLKIFKKIREYGEGEPEKEALAGRHGDVKKNTRKSKAGGADDAVDEMPAEITELQDSMME